VPHPVVFGLAVHTTDGAVARGDGVVRQVLLRGLAQARRVRPDTVGGHRSLPPLWTSAVRSGRRPLPPGSTASNTLRALVHSKGGGPIRRPSGRPGTAGEAWAGDSGVRAAARRRA